MATGEQAIAAIAMVTGYDRAYVARSARILREAGDDLWPQSGRGGGKSAQHVRPSHLTNILISLAVAEPATTGPDRVRAFRMLAYQGGDISPPTTFGIAMDAIITGLSQDVWARNAALAASGHVVELYPTQRASARITSGLFKGDYSAADVDTVRVALLIRQRVSGITTVSLIRASVLSHIGSLLAETPDEERITVSVPDGVSLLGDPAFTPVALNPTEGPTSKSGASLAGEAPQSTRPSDEGISETPPTDNRSLDNGDGIPCVCVSATPEADGGQPPTVEAHHDEREPGD
jgi:hypothetical protein